MDLLSLKFSMALLNCYQQHATEACNWTSTNIAQQQTCLYILSLPAHQKNSQTDVKPQGGICFFSDQFLRKG